MGKSKTNVEQLNTLPADLAALSGSLGGKQAALVSGVNIKTINGQAVLGSGDLVVSAAGAVTSVAGKTGAVTLAKADVGLGNVDNTSDANKPISTATQTALATKQAALVSGVNIKTINGQAVTGSGDLVVSAAGAVTSVAGKTGAVTLAKADVGLGNVDNTSDANKPISTATQTALATKQATLVSGVNIKTINGQAVTGSGDLVVSAAGAVTSVAGKTGDVTLAPSDVGAEPADATILKSAAIGVTVQGYDAATAKRNTANTFTEVQSFGKGVQETYSAVAASNIDVTAGGVFAKTISGATTFTVSNAPAAGAVASFILELTNPGTNVTFWAGVKWPGGTTPTLTAAGVDVLGFYTRDGGTTWRGLVLAKDSK